MPRDGLRGIWDGIKGIWDGIRKPKPEKPTKP